MYIYIYNIYVCSIHIYLFNNEIYNYLKSVADEIDKNLIITICGSYRRLKPSSNDIDVLLTHKKIKTKSQLESKENYLHIYISHLKKDGFLLAVVGPSPFTS